MGVRVYGLAHRGLSPPNLSRYCAGTVRAGDNGRPTDDPAWLLEELGAAGRKLGEGTILLAGTDEWELFMAAHDKELAKTFRFPHLPFELVRDLASKEGLYGLAARYGFPTPRVVSPRNSAEAAELAKTLQYPVMLKPIYSRPAVSMKAVVRDRDTLLASYKEMEEHPDAPNVMFQEYIPGGDTDVWMFDGYFNEESRCLVAFTGYKLRQQPAHMGHTSLGVCQQNPRLIEATTRFLTAAGYRGVVDIGFRFDDRDGQYKILDVNPRVGGNFRQFVDRNGLDVVRALYLDFTGQRVPPVVPSDGRRWVKEDSELVALREYRRLEGLRLRDWISSLRGVEEGATFSLTDPLPFLGAMVLLVYYTLNGRWSRTTERWKRAIRRRLRSRRMGQIEVTGSRQQ